MVTHRISSFGLGGRVICVFPIQDLACGLQEEFILRLYQGGDLSHCLPPTNDLLWNSSHLGNLHVSPSVHWEENSIRHFGEHPRFCGAAPWLPTPQARPFRGVGELCPRIRVILDLCGDITNVSNISHS